MQTRPLLALPRASGMVRPPVKVVASVKRRYQSVADGRPGRPNGHRRIYGTFSYPSEGAMAWICKLQICRRPIYRVRCRWIYSPFRASHTATHDPCAAACVMPIIHPYFIASTTLTFALSRLNDHLTFAVK